MAGVVGWKSRMKAHNATTYVELGNMLFFYLFTIAAGKEGDSVYC